MASLLLQVLVPYTSYVKYLKWLTLSLFAYVAAAFFVQISWSEVAHATFLPKLTWNRAYLTGLVAVLGTTISPYLFFWQASQEVEEVKNHRGEKALKRPVPSARAAGTNPHGHLSRHGAVERRCVFHHPDDGGHVAREGHHDVATAAQAAQALRPLGGLWATGCLSAELLARECWRYRC